MLEYKFDIQLHIEGEGLSEEAIGEHLAAAVAGDSLLVVGDETLIKIHYHTNAPWAVLAYGGSLGDVFDVVVENMERQENGLHG